MALYASFCSIAFDSYSAVTRSSSRVKSALLRSCSSTRMVSSLFRLLFSDLCMTRSTCAYSSCKRILSAPLFISLIYAETPSCIVLRSIVSSDSYYDRDYSRCAVSRSISPVIFPISFCIAVFSSAYAARSSLACESLSKVVAKSSFRVVLSFTRASYEARRPKFDWIMDIMFLACSDSS